MKVVYWKDETFLIVKDDVTWEYENDINWSKTEDIECKIINMIIWQLTDSYIAADVFVYYNSKNEIILFDYAGDNVFDLIDEDELQRVKAIIALNPEKV